MSYEGLHDVDMSELASSTEGGQGMSTQALVTCVAIAVTVDYASKPLPGESARDDKFLAHIDEDNGGKALAVLVQQVGEAKKRVVKNMHVVVCVLSPESLRDRPEERPEEQPVDEAVVGRQVSLNKRCIALARGLTDGVRSSSFMVLRQHIYEPRNMVITAENEIRVDSYEWDPERNGRQFRGFPHQVQLSSVPGIRDPRAERTKGVRNVYV